MPEWCVLWWTTNYMDHSGVYYIPTNFPTSKLRVYADYTAASGSTIAIAKGWHPDRQVEVSIVPVSSIQTTNQTITINVWTTWAGSANGASCREINYIYYPDLDVWQCNSKTLTYGYTVVSVIGAGGNESIARGVGLKNGGPSTVEEWLAVRGFTKE